MSRFRVFAASLALLAHTFAIGAPCLCSTDVMAAEMKGPNSAMPCHESAPGFSLSSLEDCCCDNNPAEGGTSSLVAQRMLDASSPQTLQLKAPSVPWMPALRTALPSTSHQGATAPRPPLRV